MLVIGIIFSYIILTNGKPFECSLLIESDYFEKLFSIFTIQIDLHNTKTLDVKRGIIRQIMINEKQFSAHQFHTEPKSRVLNQRRKKHNTHIIPSLIGLGITSYKKATLLNFTTKIKHISNQLKLRWRNIMSTKGTSSPKEVLKFKLGIPIGKDKLLYGDRKYMFIPMAFSNIYKKIIYVEFSIERDKLGRIVLKTNGVFNYMNNINIHCQENIGTRNIAEGNRKENGFVDYKHQEPMIITVIPEYIEKAINNKRDKMPPGASIKVDNRDLCVFVGERMIGLQSYENCDGSVNRIRNTIKNKEFAASFIKVYAIN